MNANMQLATTSFWYLFPWQGLFPDNSLTVNKFPDISLTGFKFHDISRFSRQVVTLFMRFSVKLLHPMHLGTRSCITGPVLWRAPVFLRTQVLGLLVTYFVVVAQFATPFDNSPSHAGVSLANANHTFANTTDALQWHCHLYGQCGALSQRGQTFPSHLSVKEPLVYYQLV